MIPFHVSARPAVTASAPVIGSDLLALAQAVKTPLCVVDARGRVLHANPCFARAAGAADAALAGTGWLSCLASDAQAPAVAAWITGVGRDEPFMLEAALQPRDGVPGFSLWQVVPVVEGGVVARWIIMAAPVQPPDSGQDRSNTSPGWYQETFEQAAAGIAHVAPDGTFLDANDRFCAIVGHEHAALLQGGFQRITHPEDLGEDQANVAALLDGRIAHYAIEKRYVRADGTTVWAHLAVGLVRRADGSADHFIAVVNDISQRKAAQAALEAQQRLTRFQLRLSEWVHNLTDPLEMMQAATAALGMHLGAAQVGFGEIDAAQEHVTVHRDWNDGRIASVVGTWRMDNFGPAFIRDLKAGHTIAIPDVELDARTSAPEVLQAYAGIRTRSILDKGLIRGGRLVAMLFIHHPQPRTWTPEEVELVEHTCERLWSAVERARAEAALARSEAHLQAVLDALPVGVVITDAQGGVVRHNSANLALWGVPPETTSWEQYADWEGYWSDSGQRIAAQDWALARALRQGETVRGEAVTLQPFGGGPRRHCLNNAAPVRDRDGHTVGGVAVTLDITQQRAAQAALAERERVLSLFVRNAPAAIAMFDTGMRYLAASRRFLLDFGLPPDVELPGRLHYEVFPSLPAHWRAVHARVLQGDEVAQDMDVFVHQDGRQDWVRWSMCPWHDAQGQVAGALLMSELITPQVRVEQERELALQRLRDSEAQARHTAALLENVIESIPDPIWTKDLDSRFSLLNSAAARVLGGTRSTLLGKRDRDLLPAAFAYRISQEDRRILGAGECIQTDETLLDTSTGRQRHYESVKLPLRDAQGRITGLLGVARDVTERHAAQQEMRIAAVAFEAQEGLAITDAHGMLLRVNRAMCNLTGHAAPELVGEGLIVLIPDRRNLSSCEARTRQLQHEGRWSGDLWMVRKNAQPFLGWVGISAVRDGSGAATHFVVSATDITQRKHAEAALVQSQQDLGELAQRLMAQERETTQRLAQLLHDGLGQTLGALQLHMDLLGAASAVQALPSQQQRHVLTLHTLSRQAVAEVRTALVELRPPMLQEQGLVAALDHKLQLRRQHGHDIAFTMVAEPELLGLRWPDEVEYAFFMVAGEALANAVLHAGASRIECAVEGGEDWLRLRLRDDGRGASDDLHRPGHLGVVGMRERALAIGATFAIKGRPGKGTVVTLEWESDADDAHLPG